MKTMATTKLKLIAYCGLYCPKCYKMKIAASAKQLSAELKSAEEKGAKFLQESSEIEKVLNKLISLECKKFCREGGGKSSTCPIKICCAEHKIQGCWECLNFDSCKMLKSQFVNNNRKIKELGIDKYIKQYK